MHKGPCQSPIGHTSCLTSCNRCQIGEKASPSGSQFSPLQNLYNTISQSKRYHQQIRFCEDMFRSLKEYYDQVSNYMNGR